MKPSVLLDTNIVIDLLGGVEAAYAVLARERRLAISRIVWIEILAGLKLEEERLLRPVFERFSILEVSARIAMQTVEVRRTTRLKLPDAIIYATAQVHGLRLLTRNIRDFSEGMPGVQIPYSL